MLCSEGWKRGHDLRLRYDHGCHNGYDSARLSLDTLTFLIRGRGAGAFGSLLGRPYQRACFFVWSPLCFGRRTRLQHSIDNVCHFFTLSRSSINEQTFGDVSYGSGSRVCIYRHKRWVPLIFSRYSAHHHGLHRVSFTIRQVFTFLIRRNATSLHIHPLPSRLRRLWP